MKYIIFYCCISVYFVLELTDHYLDKVGCANSVMVHALYFLPSLKFAELYYNISTQMNNLSNET